MSPQELGLVLPVLLVVDVFVVALHAQPPPLHLYLPPLSGSKSLATLCVLLG